MEVEYDKGKNQKNIELRGIDFELAKFFDFTSALIFQDIRKDYGEKRYSAIGYIDQDIFVLIFTPRGQKLRVISLRKANKREKRKYHEQ